MKILNSLFQMIGRWAIASIFLIAGVMKMTSYEATAGYMASKGLPLIPVLLVAAAILEIVGALALILGWKTRFFSFLLFLFLIPTTYFFHDFWTVTDPVLQQLQQWAFFKNVAIAGALLFLFGTGAGCCSIDACCRRKEECGSCCSKHAHDSCSIKSKSDDQQKPF